MKMTSSIKNEKLSFAPTPFGNLHIVKRQRNGDLRGFFDRIYCKSEFYDEALNFNVKQVNHSFTHRRGSVRGMHFQVEPYAEEKLVTCLSGEVFDVVVDVRTGSSTFLQNYSQVLSQKNSRSLYIPVGFAHGFQTLTDNCQLLYLHSSNYSPVHERNLNVLDPSLAINWPLPIGEISEKDKNHSFISSTYEGIQTK